MMGKKLLLFPLFLIGFTIISVAFNVWPASGQKSLNELSSDQWLEDLQFLSRKINKEFTGFTPQSKNGFNRAVNKLEEKISSLSSTEIIIEMNKMVASLNDGHTELNLLQSEIGFKRLPLIMYYFGEDLHIIFTSPQYQSLLGAKVQTIGGQTVEKVHESILPFLAHDNEIEFLLEAPNYMTATDLLTYLNLTDTPDRINLTVKDSQGLVQDITVEAINRKEYSEVDWMSVRENSKRPLYLDNSTDYYWYTFLNKEKTLYFKCNRMDDQKGKPSLKKTITGLFRELDQKKPEKLIIDLRLNRGGNYQKGLSLIKQIQSRPSINQKGKIFVLTDRYTFSAASAITGFLKRDTNALTAGEPGRSRPNGADNYEPYSLPNSKIHFGVTNRMRELYPELGDQPYIPIDVLISTPFVNYQKGDDLVLKGVLNY